MYPSKKHGIMVAEGSRQREALALFARSRILSRCNNMASQVLSNIPAKSTITATEPDASSHASIGSHGDLNF